MPQLLIILSPPRSFSSVVSTMIGQHPELYCFPELHLFVARTVGDILDREAKKGNYIGPPGVLRSLAQLHSGRQTTGTLIQAGAWLTDRRDWSVKALIDHLLDAVAPRVGVEKSPVTCMKSTFLGNAYADYPSAYYLHLTRHPLSTRKSMDEFFGERKQVKARAHRAGAFAFDHLVTWYRMHRNIYEFTARLQSTQIMRIKGEDLLSEPRRYLPQIAAWLGVSTDAGAINEMLHPERSPYACIGPPPARGGNDGKFMRSPALREGRLKEPLLHQYLESHDVDWLMGEDLSVLQRLGLEVMPGEAIAAEIQGLTERMGYR